MNQIERYILRRVLVLSIGTLLATATIAMTTQVLLRVDLLSSTGQSLLAFLRLAGLVMPTMMVIVMPFALMIGAAQTLSTMNSDSELAVIEASGGSRALIARPILLVAALMSLLSLAESNYVEPWVNKQIKILVNQASADLFSAAVQSGTFHKVENNLYVSVADKLPGGQLGGIFLADERDEDFDLLYYAKHGAFTESGGKDLLVLSDGELHRRENGSGNVSIIRFATYALDLSLIGGGSGQTGAPVPKERPTSYLFNPDPQDPYYERNPRDFIKRINKRLSEWLYPLTFGFITVYFLGKAHSNRHEQVWSVVTAASIAFLLRGFGFYAVDESSSSRIFSILCYAVPLGAIAICTLLMITNWTFRTPRFLLDLSSRVFSDEQPAMAHLRNWLSELTGNGRRSAQ
ncbi:LptF/LptG family permease [Nitratireductor sp. XY-223]|uniref:LptF/LptG family permease n=1 Tax=Nitratireductor sp. XY-223 TaxID=2561926 RepID=UPI0010AAA30C|nr:LptF/LptG family permease [Nitratireductor sp. XY-223]